MTGFWALIVWQSPTQKQISGLNGLLGCTYSIKVKNQMKIYTSMVFLKVFSVNAQRPLKGEVRRSPRVPLCSTSLTEGCLCEEITPHLFSPLITYLCWEEKSNPLFPKDLRHFQTLLNLKS